MMDRFERLLAEGKINAVNPILAARLNRDDLTGFNPPLIADPYTTPQNTAGQIQAAVSGLDSGRISAGLVGLLVVGGVLFYVWTRKFQS